MTSSYFWTLHLFYDCCTANPSMVCISPIHEFGQPGLLLSILKGACAYHMSLSLEASLPFLETFFLSHKPLHLIPSI